MNLPTNYERPAILTGEGNVMVFEIDSAATTKLMAFENQDYQFEEL